MALDKPNAVSVVPLSRFSLQGQGSRASQGFLEEHQQGGQHQSFTEPADRNKAIVLWHVRGVGTLDQAGIDPEEALACLGKDLKRIGLISA